MITRLLVSDCGPVASAELLLKRSVDAAAAVRSMSERSALRHVRCNDVFACL